MSMTKINDDALEQVSGGTILRYIVQPGDTIKSIADKFHVTEDQLKLWNRITNSNALIAGQQVKVFY